MICTHTAMLDLGDTLRELLKQRAGWIGLTRVASPVVACKDDRLY